jgi:hypothetical protein
MKKELTKAEKAKRLTKLGWSMVDDTDEEQTWTHFRKLTPTWPESMQKKYGTQCYWSLEECWQTQMEIEAERRAERKKNEKPRLVFRNPSEDADWNFKCGFAYAIGQINKKKYKVVVKKSKFSR